MNSSKNIKQAVAFLICGWLFIAQAFAGGGVKTVIKGTIQDAGIKTLYLYNRESVFNTTNSVSVAADGQFQLVAVIAKPGYYMVSSDKELPAMWTFYLTPGDQITMAMNNGQVVLSGKGSKLNQFLFDLCHSHPYQGDLAQVYNNRINTIKTSTNEDVIRNKALLLGNEQGAYLDQVFGPILEAKAHATANRILEPNISDLKIRLVPEVMVYPKWNQTITELMFARMRAGELKVRNANTWMADFGSAIESQKLKESYILSLLDYSAILGDFRSIDKEMKEALPSIKDPKNIAQISVLKAKIAKNKSMYKYAPEGTDMSGYTFLDMKGKQLSVADLKGKYLFIDIWNTGCKPCIAEMPFLKQLEQDMEGKDIVFLSVSCDYKADLWLRFLQKRNITGDHQLIMNGTTNTFFDKIGKSGIPRFVILDKEGKVVDNNCCKRPSNPLLKLYLTELLNQSL